MFDYSEFEAFLNKMDAETEIEMARQGGFIKSLENALIDLSIRHFPETERHKLFFIDALTQMAHQRAIELNELLDLLIGGYNIDHSPSDNNYQIPERDVTLSENQFLEETLTNLPPEQHACFIESNAKRIKIEAKERDFVFLCHDKAKELICKYYPEIVDFSGNSIRNVNQMAYIYMDEWVYDFYYCASDYMNDISIY